METTKGILYKTEIFEFKSYLVIYNQYDHFSKLTLIKEYNLYKSWINIPMKERKPNKNHPGGQRDHTVGREFICLAHDQPRFNPQHLLRTTRSDRGRSKL